MPENNDPRYEVPVNKMDPLRLKRALETSLKNAAMATPAGTGIIVFLFDFGEGGGCGYISNAQRSDCIQMLEEWIAHQRKLS
jgi:predicted TIM-barrel enzyme